MKNVLTTILALVIIIFSGCSTTNSTLISDFWGKIGNDFFSGETQVDDTRPSSLFIRGYEKGDTTNGKFFTIILDDYKGPGSYETQQYSYAQLIGGDAVSSIARAENFVGTVTVGNVNGEFVSGTFSGNLIVQETGEEINSNITFKIKKVAPIQN